MRIGLVLVDNKKIKKLNKSWFGKNQTTDVMAFPLGEELPDGTYLLGDVVINLDQAKGQAKKYKITLREEITRLIVHGALHLLGFDDQELADQKKMQKLQEKIVRETLSKKTS